MAVRAHGVITLPARDTVLGGLSDQGSRVELAVVPRHHDALGSCYAVHFVVEDVGAAAAATARTRLEEVFACIVDSQYDARTRQWTASGWVPVQNVAPRVFRLLEEAPDGTAPAWVVMRDGLAQVRLRPVRGPLEGFLARLSEAVKAHGVTSEILVMDLDDEPHQARLAVLHDLEQPVIA